MQIKVVFRNIYVSVARLCDNQIQIINILIIVSAGGNDFLLRPFQVHRIVIFHHLFDKVHLIMWLDGVQNAAVLVYCF